MEIEHSSPRVSRVNDTGPCFDHHHEATRRLCPPGLRRLSRAVSGTTTRLVEVTYSGERFPFNESRRRPTLVSLAFSSSGKSVKVLRFNRSRHAPDDANVNACFGSISAALAPTRSGAKQLLGGHSTAHSCSGPHLPLPQP
jgi:hypothetical protein